MAQEQAIDITRLIDERGINAFNVGLVIFTFFVILFDGYDIGAAAFAAPHLVKEWGLPSPAALATMFSAGLFGILFGAPLFGYIGDRYGRKVAIIGSCLTFGIFTWLACWAGSLQQLTYLRFFAGIGIGGVLPNVIALNAEYAPRRFRATMVIVMFCGITLGGGVPSLVSARLVPDYGWQALFFVGGVAPIVVAALAVFLLPESLKFLVVKGDRRDHVIRLVRSIDPSRAPDAGTRFTIPDEHQYTGFSPAYLFRDGLELITPLLWVCFVVNLMGFYFLSVWMPIVMTGVAHLPPALAGYATAMVQVGGTIGGLAIARPLDLKGMVPICVLFVLAIPCVGAVGYAAESGSTNALLIVAFLAGFCILGLQFGLNATSAMIYPTSFRSNGSGWAFAVGRFGSVAGPYFGAFLLSMKLPLHDLYLYGTAPLIVGAVASIALARLYAQTFRGSTLGQRTADATGD